MEGEASTTLNKSESASRVPCLTRCWGGEKLCLTVILAQLFDTCDVFVLYIVSRAARAWLDVHFFGL